MANRKNKDKEAAKEKEEKEAEQAERSGRHTRPDLSIIRGLDYQFVGSRILIISYNLCIPRPRDLVKASPCLASTSLVLHPFRCSLSLFLFFSLSQFPSWPHPRNYYKSVIATITLPLASISSCSHYNNNVTRAIAVIFLRFLLLPILLACAPPEVITLYPGRRRSDRTLFFFFVGSLWSLSLSLCTFLDVNRTTLMLLVSSSFRFQFSFSANFLRYKAQRDSKIILANFIIKAECNLRGTKSTCIRGRLWK